MMAEISFKNTLTPRERQCLHWASQGKTVAETAIILSLSNKTVRHYLDDARDKLNASNVTHAVSKAIRFDLINKPANLPDCELSQI